MSGWFLFAFSVETSHAADVRSKNNISPHISQTSAESIKIIPIQKKLLDWEQIVPFSGFFAQKLSLYYFLVIIGSNLPVK